MSRLTLTSKNEKIRKENLKKRARKYEEEKTNSFSKKLGIAITFQGGKQTDIDGHRLLSLFGILGTHPII